MRQIGFGQQLYDNYAYDGYDIKMQIDDEYLAQMEPENEGVRSGEPTASSSASTTGSHAPSPLYAPYYSKNTSVPEEQLGMFTGSDFTTELPEEPPPFEHCYAPGDTPKQFTPKPVN